MNKYGLSYPNIRTYNKGELTGNQILGLGFIIVALGAGALYLAPKALQTFEKSLQTDAPILKAYCETLPIKEGEVAWPLIEKIATKENVDPQEVEYNLDHTAGNGNNVGNLNVGDQINIPAMYKADVDPGICIPANAPVKPNTDK